MDLVKGPSRKGLSGKDLLAHPPSNVDNNIVYGII